MNIKHQQQPSSDTCVSACIAMLMDRPVEEIVEEFHDYFFTDRLGIAEYLHHNSMKCNQMIAEPQRLNIDRVYLLSVPSLNHRGLGHCIILHYDADEQYHILDPNKGRENKHYYVEDYQEVVHKNEMRLRSWIATHEIELS